MYQHCVGCISPWIDDMISLLQRFSHLKLTKMFNVHIIVNWFTVLKVRSVLSFAGDCHALHASRLFGKSPEVHRQGSNATRETKKFVPQLIPLLYKEKVSIMINYIMWNYASWILKKKKTFCSPCLYTSLIFISLFQCWTAAPSSLPFKSFYWSTSSCADSSQATRPLHYKRYIVSVAVLITGVLVYLICGNLESSTL